MRKFIAPLLLALAGSSVAFTPPASALEIVADCSLSTVAQEDATGGQDTFTGAAWGYAVDTASGPATVHCDVRVNSATVASTPDGSGTTSGQVTFTATDSDDVDLCTVVNGADFKCEDVTTTQIPPQAVIDAINDLFTLVGELTAGIDPVVCGAIKTAGLPGIVNSATSITGIYVDPDDCDIWIIVDTVIFVCPARIIDFVPYDDPYNGPGPNC